MVSVSLDKFARLIGIPFKERGRDPASGLDCWGLGVEALRLFGHEVPSFNVACFSTAAIHGVYIEESKKWEKIETPEPGCVVAMKLDPKHPDMVQHFGVYLGAGIILHTLKKLQSHCVRIDDYYWKNRIEGFYRWKG